MLKIADLHPEYIIDEKGKKNSVILPIEDFIELIEDLEDLSIIAERRDEQTVSHEELLKDLKNNGVLK
jgi:PHD/YefM family antitoxin component YafN of YafNO toxin-antitoxin module